MSQETEVQKEVWHHLLATLESHKEGGGEGREQLRVRRLCPSPGWRCLAFSQGAPEVTGVLGMFLGQTKHMKASPPGTPPDSGIDHCPDRGGCCFGEGVCLQPAPPLTTPGYDP